MYDSSPKLKKGIRRNPASWNKGVRAGLPFEEFKQHFERVQEVKGKGYVVPHLTDKDYKVLFSEYKGKRVAVPKIKKVTIPMRVPAVRRVVWRVKAKGYTRKGKRIKGYSSRRVKWTVQGERWLSSRVGERNNTLLTKNFNKFFRTKRTVKSIKSKKLRLRRRRKK